MKKTLRPTVPLADWRIALDLKATNRLHQIESPDGGEQGFKNCKCKQCRNWRTAWRQMFPASILEQLARFGIDLDRPTGYYWSYEGEKTFRMRFTYHCIGRLLSTYNTWARSEYGDVARFYEKIGEQGHDINLSVIYEKNLDDYSTYFPKSLRRNLIQIDFRLIVPWVLHEPPPVRRAPAEKDTRSHSWKRYTGKYTRLIKKEKEK